MWSARFQCLVALCGSCAVAIGCSSATEPTPNCRHGDRVAVTVSPGPTPQFTWSPACPVNYLSVTGGGETMWFLEGNGNSIPSGTRYGNAATPLVIGSTYSVAVGIRYSDIDFYYYEVIGSKTFIP